jgi:riboflavin kinase/FMN adenylyltransferase
MQYFDSIDHAKLRGAYLAIGSFDGLHRGHRHLLEKMILAAGENNAPSAAVTFFPHPRAVLRPADSPPFRYLTTMEERLALLRELPLDSVILQPFDLEFSKIAAVEFLQTLENKLGLRSFWCGPSFSIGHRRGGDIAFLTERSLIDGFSLYVVPPLADSEGPISSTRIRRALAAGDPPQAAGLLGRPFTLSGPVVHGAGRGRKMGMPTANIAVWPDIVVPCYGVYATWAVRTGLRIPSVTSIGIRPTFEKDVPHEATVETHLLDFDGDLYDTTLRVEFAARLRPERKFPGMEALQAQMAEDIRQARMILREER